MWSYWSGDRRQNQHLRTGGARDVLGHLLWFRPDDNEVSSWYTEWGLIIFYHPPWTKTVRLLQSRWLVWLYRVLTIRQATEPSSVYFTSIDADQQDRLGTICTTSKGRNSLCYVVGAFGKLCSSGSWLLTSWYGPSKQRLPPDLLVPYTGETKAVTKEMECGGPNLPEKDFKAWPSKPKEQLQLIAREKKGPTRGNHSWTPSHQNQRARAFCDATWAIPIPTLYKATTSTANASS